MLHVTAHQNVMFKYMYACLMLYIYNYYSYITLYFVVCYFYKYENCFVSKVHHL